jgi:hypothetical protein
LDYPNAGRPLASVWPKFSVLGFRKDLFEPQVIESSSGVLKVVAALQTGIGVVLLFLFSLALRNRFRMK